MEKLNDLKFIFNKVSKSEMKYLIGGEEGTWDVCCYPTTAAPGGDTAHDTVSDTGGLITSYWTKGNTMQRCE